MSVKIKIGTILSTNSPQKWKDELEKVHNTTLKSLIEWKATPSGIDGRIRQLLAKINIGTIEEKQPAPNPYEFQTIRPDKEEEYENRLKLIKTVATVCLVVTVLFLAVGLLGPLLAMPLLMSLPLFVAPPFIIATTTLGVGGVVIAVAIGWVNDHLSLRKLRAEADKDFQFFVKKIVQNPNPQADFRFNLQDAHLVDARLHKIFIDWKNGVNGIKTQPYTHKFVF